MIFFFASAGASSAYLTVSEIFPIELRGQAISFFFAISQLTGGVVAPFLFASLIGEGDNPARGPLTVGYIIGAVVMLIGGVIAWFFGVDAEGQSLENVATPLSAADRAVDPLPGHDPAAAKHRRPGPPDHSGQARGGAGRGPASGSAVGQLSARRMAAIASAAIRCSPGARHQAGAVERAAEQVQFGGDPGGEERLGVGDALVAQRVELAPPTCTRAADLPGPSPVRARRRSKRPRCRGHPGRGSSPS